MTTREHDRKSYLALFITADRAIEFEQQCLSIGRDLLPAFAIAVLDGKEPDGRYWDWLASQAVQAEYEAQPRRTIGLK